METNTTTERIIRDAIDADDYNTLADIMLEVDEGKIPISEDLYAEADEYLDAFCC